MCRTTSGGPFRTAIPYCVLLCLFAVLFRGDAAWSQDLSAGSSATETLPPPVTSALPPINGSGVAAAAAIPAQTQVVAGQPRGLTMLNSLSSAGQSFCTKLRQSSIGQLVGGLRKPLSVVSGGLVAAEKKPHPDEQAQPGAAGSAAQVKAAALEAPKRQAAVRELQGVDVRYHPEAEVALIAALRTDPSECVRLEAARTFTSLPVCTKAIAEALQICVESSQRDGNPAELSQRVRLQAEIALAHCQFCLPGGPEDHSKERPEYPGEPVYPASDRFPPGSVAPASAIESVERNFAPRNPSAHQLPGSNSPGLTSQPKNLAEVIRAARGG